MVGTFGFFTISLPVTLAAFAKNSSTRAPSAPGCSTARPRPARSAGPCSPPGGGTRAATDHRQAAALLASAQVVASFGASQVALTVLIVLVGAANLGFLTSAQSLVQLPRSRSTSAGGSWRSTCSRSWAAGPSAVRSWARSTSARGAVRATAGRGGPGGGDRPRRPAPREPSVGADRPDSDDRPVPNRRSSPATASGLAAVGETRVDAEDVALTVLEPRGLAHAAHVRDSVVPPTPGMS